MEPQNKKRFPAFIAPLLFVSGLVFLLMGVYFMYTTLAGDYTLVRNVLFLCGIFDLIIAAVIFVLHRHQNENL